MLQLLLMLLLLLLVVQSVVLLLGLLCVCCCAHVRWKPQVVYMVDWLRRWQYLVRICAAPTSTTRHLRAAACSLDVAMECLNTWLQKVDQLLWSVLSTPT